MTVATGNILLYSPDAPNFDIAMAAAAVAGVPVSPNVLGDWTDIWNHTDSGNYLVIAVGANANNALYFNPCDWGSPNGEAGGSTPFSNDVTEPLSSIPSAGYYENAAGTTAMGTLKLATMLAYYAVNGEYPSGYGSLPALESASSTCSSAMSSDQGCTC